MEPRGVALAWRSLYQRIPTDQLGYRDAAAMPSTITLPTLARLAWRSRAMPLPTTATGIPYVRLSV
ncbi:hypothetical protein ABID95_000334 [Streptomyces atratus]